jgi:hypothetical protein
VDGTGQPRYLADVAIVGDRIAAIGPALPKATDAREIDVSGKIVAPGFIDVHTHDDRAFLASPEMAAKTSRGVTTVITGNCGISLAPLTLDQSPPPPLDLIGGVNDYAYPRFGDYLDALDKSPPALTLLWIESMRRHARQLSSRLAIPAPDMIRKVYWRFLFGRIRVFGTSAFIGRFERPLCLQQADDPSHSPQ